MCGIVGCLNLDHQKVDPELINKMTSTLSHRGPDGEGIWVHNSVGFGHTRLAVVDLTNEAHQPMVSNNGRFVLTYNGEIYNFPEIRKELEGLGHSFRSTGDTEVLLSALIQWGVDAVPRFNGMFAFGFWDRVSKKLLLGRDRYGIKPLYYSMNGNVLLFASEQKAILKHPSIKREVDLEALLEYFTFQNIFTDRTLLKGIHIFPAGSTVVVTQGQTRSISPVQYWDFDFRDPECLLSEGEYKEELDFLFKRAVRRQLVSDVELGTYLSGGVDSGSITALAADRLPNMKTFTCGFDMHSASGLELAFDEREKAEHMSYLFQTEHYQMVLKAGDMNRCLPRLVYHLEEPRVGQSYPNYYVAQLASKFVKVVLGGTGGDELFGGYPWRYYRAAVCNDFEDYIDKYYLFWQRLIPNQVIQDAFAPVWPDVKDVWTRDIFRGVFKNRKTPCTPNDFINNSLYFEAKTFLHGLLIMKDKLSMAHGLESRVPFLDNDLVDFAMQVPVSLKLGNLGEVARINENEPAKMKKYFSKTRDGKLILRKVMANYVPENIANGVKQGFSAPDLSWFKGDSIKQVNDVLMDKDAVLYNYLDASTIKKLVSEHMEGRQNRRLFIWSLLYFNLWCKTFL
ncbi:MAG: asparagine synthase (glutamine-hydrolyzing) [Desulfobacula sp.]|jgi:asparagine synthase (glutamine-hydrolysing)|nr:asparagine synthase (glutamine-hydrolyzing) [Desulfobacula sp.]